jgi:hypothetical protein
MAELAGRPAPERACLRMTGADARTVLQGVVTNDVERVGTQGAVYAALLTPQGKYLFDFFLVADGPEDVLIDVTADRAEALAKRLKMYCLRRDARIAPAGDVSVLQLWPGEAEAHPPAPSASPGQSATVVADPRDPALGWRIYVAEGDAGDAVAAFGARAADASEWTARRIALGIPESGAELVPEETFILEAGLERLSGVDFRKGCYVGQEVTARMKHKATLKKGLLRVELEGTAPPGTPVTTAAGKPAGTLFSSESGQGLALLRLDRAEPPLTAGEARITACDPPAPEG